MENLRGQREGERVRSLRCSRSGREELAIELKVRSNHSNGFSPWEFFESVWQLFLVQLSHLLIPEANIPMVIMA
jgi:hypothetical protein